MADQLNPLLKFTLFIEQKYGDSNFKLDLVFTAIIIALVIFFDKGLIGTIGIFLSFKNAGFEFFGILVGFLITAFSMLLTFNPQGSPILEHMRKQKEFKKILYAFISTSFVIIILSFFVFFIPSDAEKISLLLLYPAIAVAVFSLMRLFRCFYYLYAIIELS